jgi:acyl-coenzyme A thioesterase PaaI-like protein
MEIHPRVIHAGGRSAVADAIVYVDGGIVARAGTTFRAYAAR